ncbi:DNA glycosylase AlkZ-like family protein [Streptosporangium lutulentum]
MLRPRPGRKVTYTGPDRWLPGFVPADTRAALTHVVKSYLHAYGPATPQRFAHWLNAPARWASDLFASLVGELQRVEVEGAAAWVTAGDTAAPSTPPRGVRLLPYFDGYAYRVGNQPPGLLYPGRAAERVLRGNFQTLLVDGVVAGLWHQRRSGRRIDITVEPLVDLTAAQRDELDHQGERVGEILEARPRLTIGVVTVGGHA